MNRNHTLTLLAGLLLATAACSDEQSPLDPTSGIIVQAAPAALAAAPNADVTDAIERILPALPQSGESQQLAALLRQLERDDDVAASRRDAALAAAILDRLERSADESQQADLGVIRLVLDARQ